MPDQSGHGPARLTRHVVRNILHRCLSGELAVSELPRWAENVHTLDNIEIDEADADLLTQFLFEISTPELFEPVTTEVCQKWADRFT